MSFTTVSTPAWNTFGKRFAGVRLPARIVVSGGVLPPFFFAPVGRGRRTFLLWRLEAAFPGGINPAEYAKFALRKFCVFSNSQLQ
jgi:hypothetical protein